MKVKFLQLSLFSSLRRAVPQSASPRVTELQECWNALVDQYFPERQDLKRYVVGWARRRQRRTLGSCNLTRQRVNIARELNAPEHLRWRDAVLYHELCHAVLGTEVRSACGRRAWHGKEFRALEARHPDSAALDHWMRSGGWAKAVRQARGREQWLSRAASGGPRRGSLRRRFR